MTSRKGNWKSLGHSKCLKCNKQCACVFVFVCVCICACVFVFVRACYVCVCVYVYAFYVFVICVWGLSDVCRKDFAAYKKETALTAVHSRTGKKLTQQVSQGLTHSLTHY